MSGPNLPKPPTQFDCLHSRVQWVKNPNRPGQCEVCHLGADWLVDHLKQRHGISEIVIGPKTMSEAGQFHRELHARYSQDHDDHWLGSQLQPGRGGHPQAKPACPNCGDICTGRFQGCTTVCEHRSTYVPGDPGFPIPMCRNCNRMRSDLLNHLVHLCHDHARPEIADQPMWRLEELHQQHHAKYTYGKGHDLTDWSMQSTPAFARPDPETVIAELRAIAADTA